MVGHSGYVAATLRSCAMPPWEPEVVGLSLQVEGDKPEGALRFLFTLDDAEHAARCLLDAIALQRSRARGQSPILSGSPSQEVS